MTHAATRTLPANIPLNTAFIVAIVGAESTGKSALTAALTERLTHSGLRCTVVAEYLRTFCDAHKRTPTQTEQTHIADTQTRHIAQSAGKHDVVIADTTALMTAVYSDMVFADTTLYASALQAHAHAHLTLLTTLDLPWTADGLQRDGPHVRIPVDRKIRAALNRAGLSYHIVAGQGDARVDSALRAITLAHEQHLKPPSVPSAAAQTMPTASRWKHLCARCGDPDCERHLFDRPSSTTRP